MHSTIRKGVSVDDMCSKSDVRYKGITPCTGSELAHLFFRYGEILSVAYVPPFLDYTTLTCNVYNIHRKLHVSII